MQENTGLSRRKMVALGAFGGLGGAALAGAAAGTAQAADGPGVGPAKRTAKALDGEPTGTRIGSAPIGGYTYLYRSYMDFQPFTGGTWTYTGTGIWCSQGSGQLGSGIDLPPGAYLRDIEFYVAGSTTGSVAAYFWTTGSAGVDILGSLSVPSTGDVLVARRLTIPSTMTGPYSLGGRLLVWATTASTFRLNGARVGLSSLPTGTTLLATPTRVIDSRTGGGTKIGNGQTRIHDLASRIPAGATGAVLNVSVTSGEKSGGVAVYNTGSSAPSGSALYYNGGATISSEIHVKLPSDRKIKITNRGVTGCKAHYFMDLVGYTA